MSKNTGIWVKLGKLDRRIIYWVMAIVTIVILIHPVGLPLVVTQPTIKFYNTIKTMPKGSVVLMEISTTAYAWDELGPSAYAVGKMLLAQGDKLITVGVQVPEAALLAQLVFEKSGWTQKATYGVDYVNLGYIGGGETGVFNLARNFQFVNKDAYNKPLSDLPLTRDIKDANDIQLIIDVHSASSADIWYLRHWVTPYNSKFIEVVASATINAMAQYYASGQVIGYLGGAKGGAEFEYTSGYLGNNIKALDAQSFLHFFFLGFVALANIGLLVEWRRTRQ